MYRLNGINHDIALGLVWLTDQAHIPWASLVLPFLCVSRFVGIFSFVSLLLYEAVFVSFLFSICNLTFPNSVSSFTPSVPLNKSLIPDGGHYPTLCRPGPPLVQPPVLGSGRSPLAGRKVLGGARFVLREARAPGSAGFLSPYGIPKGDKMYKRMPPSLHRLPNKIQDISKTTRSTGSLPCKGGRQGGKTERVPSRSPACLLVRWTGTDPRIHLSYRRTCHASGTSMVRVTVCFENTFWVDGVKEGSDQGRPGLSIKLFLNTLISPFFLDVYVLSCHDQKFLQE